MELIDREKLKASIRSMVELPNEARAQVIGAINRAKVVDIVRCKDCKHWADGVAGCTDHVKCCEIGFYMVGENGYCVYGKRREEE